MYNASPWRSPPSVTCLKYIPGSENIRLVTGCNVMGKIRIGRFVLPFNSESVIVVPPCHACTLYVSGANEIPHYELPLHWLDKAAQQRLLANMYHKPLFISNHALKDKFRYGIAPAGTDRFITELIAHILNEVAQDGWAAPAPCDKVSSSACRLLTYIAQAPPTLDRLNVFAAAQYLQCATRSLQRVSNRAFGLPIHSMFGYHLAMEGANRVLHHGERVKEAAKVVGYATSSAFQKCFRLQIGMTLPGFLKSILEPI